MATSVPVPGAGSAVLDNETVRPLTPVGKVVVKAMALLKLPRAVAVRVV